MAFVALVDNIAVSPFDDFQLLLPEHCLVSVCEAGFASGGPMLVSIHSSRRR